MTKIIIILIILIIIYFIFYYVNESFENTYILPKHIYVYWNNIEGNIIIQSHINNIKRKLPIGWTLSIINDNNLNEYVSSKFINKYKNLNSTRFSDFLRLELLKNNGGVWLDASTIITDGTFLDKYWNEMMIYKFDATLYEFKIKTNNVKTPYLENWFIMAPKNSKLITDLYNHFNKAFQLGFLNYKKTVLIPSGVNLNGTINYGKNTYLLQHAIINYLYYIGKKYNVNIKNASESMFKIQDKYNWDHNKIINFIINNKNWKDYYAIKLTGVTRKYINKNNMKVYINTLNKI